MPLVPYEYEVRAVVSRNGQEVAETKSVKLSAGGRAELDFDLASTDVETVVTLIVPETAKVQLAGAETGLRGTRRALCHQASGPQDRRGRTTWSRSPGNKTVRRSPNRTDIDDSGRRIVRTEFPDGRGGRRLLGRRSRLAVAAGGSPSGEPYGRLGEGSRPPYSERITGVFRFDRLHSNLSLQPFKASGPWSGISRHSGLGLVGEWKGLLPWRLALHHSSSSSGSSSSSAFRPVSEQKLEDLADTQDSR